MAAVNEPGESWDAFISYRSSTGRRTATRLQASLERIARRSGRQLALFRDQTSLPVGSSLAPRIADAVGRSRHLIVVLTPDVGSSTWVDLEIRHWFASGGRVDRLLLVAGPGFDLAWGGAGWTAETAALLPPSLTGTYAEEPLWADLSAGHNDADVARLAAALLGVDVETVLQREVRAERSKRRRTVGVAAAVVLLLATAIGAGTVAMQGRAATIREQRSRIAITEAERALDTLRTDPLQATVQMRRAIDADAGAVASRAGSFARGLSNYEAMIPTGDDYDTESLLMSPDGDLVALRRHSRPAYDVWRVDSGTKVATLRFETGDTTAPVALRANSAGEPELVGCLGPDLARVSATGEWRSEGFAADDFGARCDVDPVDGGLVIGASSGRLAVWSDAEAEPWISDEYVWEWQVAGDTVWLETQREVTGDRSIRSVSIGDQRVGVDIASIQSAVAAALPPGSVEYAPAIDVDIADVSRSGDLLLALGSCSACDLAALEGGGRSFLSLTLGGQLAYLPELEGLVNASFRNEPSGSVTAAGPFWTLSTSMVVTSPDGPSGDLSADLAPPDLSSGEDDVDLKAIGPRAVVVTGGAVTVVGQPAVSEQFTTDLSGDVVDQSLRPLEALASFGGLSTYAGGVGGLDSWNDLMALTDDDGTIVLAPTSVSTARYLADETSGILARSVTRLPKGASRGALLQSASLLLLDADRGGVSMFGQSSDGPFGPAAGGIAVPRYEPTVALSLGSSIVVMTPPSFSKPDLLLDDLHPAVFPDRIPRTETCGGRPAADDPIQVTDDLKLRWVERGDHSGDLLDAFVPATWVRGGDEAFSRSDDYGLPSTDLTHVFAPEPDDAWYRCDDGTVVEPRSYATGVDISGGAVAVGVEDRWRRLPDRSIDRILVQAPSGRRLPALELDEPASTFSVSESPLRVLTVGRSTQRISVFEATADGWRRAARWSDTHPEIVAASLSPDGRFLLAAAARGTRDPTVYETLTGVAVATTRTATIDRYDLDPKFSAMTGEPLALWSADDPPRGGYAWDWQIDMWDSEQRASVPAFERLEFGADELLGDPDVTRRRMCEVVRPRRC